MTWDRLIFKSGPISLTGFVVSRLKNHKGGDPTKWPKNIRVRDYIAYIQN